MKKLALCALGLCVSLMLMNCKGQASGGNSEGDATGDSVQTGNILNVGEPSAQKFVRVVKENSEIFRYADPESPWLVTWMEDLESDMAVIVDKWSNEDVPDGYSCDENFAYAGQVFAVLGEEGDYYKVSIYNKNCDMEYGFVKKDDVEDVEPLTATAESLEEFDFEFEGIDMKIFKEGKYKGLVLRVLQDELDGITLEVGVLMNGCLAFPELNRGEIFCDPNVKELTFMGKAKEGELQYYFKYPKSMARWPEQDLMEGFDFDKLTDEQIGKIVQDMLERKSEYVKYDYLIPETEGGLLSFWMKNK